MTTEDQNMRSALTNKLGVLQVLGCLMNNPLLFLNTEYRLEPDDFPERFHRIVFGGIEWLASQGAQKISPIDLDQFIARYDVNYRIFCDNQGFDYVSRCIELADESNFAFYYKQIKKYTLLYKLHKEGMSISEYFDPSVTDPTELATKQKKFDDTSLEGIINNFEGKVSRVASDFACGGDVVEGKAGEGLSALIESFKEDEGMGEPFSSGFCTTLFRGQRFKKVILESAPSGVGKSRKALGDAAKLAIPQYYDTKKKCWTISKDPHVNPVLYICTELEFKDLQTMLVAYVAGINENTVFDYGYTPEEEERQKRAQRYVDQAPFYIVCLRDYDMEDVEHFIKKYVQVYDVHYVFFDYLMPTTKMMAAMANKTKMKNLREDQCMLEGITRLKNLANKLGVYIHTATQTNREYVNKKTIDETTLRSSMSTNDKTDVSLVMLEPRDEDEPIIAEYLRKGFTTRPNRVLHVFKMRQVNGISETKIRIYIYFDPGTCRVEDCFVTDRKGNFINVPSMEVERIPIPEIVEELERPKSSEFIL